MPTPVPDIDTRSAEDIAAAVKQRAGIEGGPNDPLGEALIRIFARYCEIIIERLNQVPEKNYRAFLNTLGVSRNPPVAACAPLTFTPVKTSADTSIVVPKYTKVAASLGAGENAPVIFETEQALAVTNAELARLIVFDVEADTYADLSGAATAAEAPAAGDVSVKGMQPAPHELYLAIPMALAQGDITALQLFFTIEPSGRTIPALDLQWRLETGDGGLTLIPSSDTTQGLSHTGSILFGGLPKWEMARRGGVDGYWLGCRWGRQAPGAHHRAANAVPTLPRIVKMEMTSYTDVTDAPIDSAFFNTVPIDLTRDFYPLGESPRFGDVFYVNSKAFSHPATDIIVTVTLSNPASAKQEPPIHRANQSGKATIQWDYWNGQRWSALPCSDSTQGLTEHGVLSFSIPLDTQPATVNGVSGNWLRARLVAGHYGQREAIQFDSHEKGVNYLLSTLAPPSVAAITVRYTKCTEPVTLEALMTRNGLELAVFDPAQSGTFMPFQVGNSPLKTLYFGFKAADRKMLAGRWLDLYFRIGHAADDLVYRGDHSIPSIDWQCWSGATWQNCEAKDDTAALQISGMVSLLIPETLACRNDLSLAATGGDALYWLRAVWLSGNDSCEAVIQRVMLNTVLARQVVTLENEILGSGNGTPNQFFYSARAPILDQLTLEVREPQRPATEELNKLAVKGGEAATDTVLEDQADQGIWVRWHRVDDFLESAADDRHFTVEPLSGEIRFGNGVNGRPPPKGANNIRLRSYKTGGGLMGNKPANSITQLRAALPLIAAVANPEVATGGYDSEAWAAVYRRGSRQLRHRGLAVTAQDYQDIAINASPEVARAKCFPLQDSGMSSTDAPVAGSVSLIIVPRSSAPAPKPSLELLRRVWNYLDSRQLPGITLKAAGPKYVRIHVDAVVVPAEGYRKTDMAMVCKAQIDNFLHPLTGGEFNLGWDFGAIPHQSDLLALLEAVPGLEFVRSIRLDYEEEQPGSLVERTFLICSGTHRISSDSGTR